MESDTHGNDLIFKWVLHLKYSPRQLISIGIIGMFHTMFSNEHHTLQTTKYYNTK